MNQSTKNLVATFTGAALGLAIEHSQAIAILYVIGGAVAAPHALRWVEHRWAQRQRASAPPSPAAVTPVSPHFE